LEETGGAMRILQISLLAAAVSLAATCDAQQGPTEAPLQIPNPHYAAISESIVVDAPVDKVWARVGGFCDITEWMNSPEWEDCKYLQGHGGPGSVRSIVNEVLVGQTQFSYTYAQPPRKGSPYNLAHGTLAAEALTPTATRLTYTMLRDVSVLPDEAARKRDEEGRRSRVSAWLENMKLLAEVANFRLSRPDPFVLQIQRHSLIPTHTMPACRCQSSSMPLSRKYGRVSASTAT
jgi:hypothetical protein